MCIRDSTKCASARLGLLFPLLANKTMTCKLSKSSVGGHHLRYHGLGLHCPYAKQGASASGPINPSILFSFVVRSLDDTVRRLARKLYIQAARAQNNPLIAGLDGYVYVQLILENGSAHTVLTWARLTSRCIKYCRLKFLQHFTLAYTFILDYKFILTE